MIEKTDPTIVVPHNSIMTITDVMFMIKFLPIYSLIKSGRAKGSSRASETIRIKEK